MANVDNLNFKVILDDKDFSSRVEKDIEAAKNLNIALSTLLDLKKKVGGSSGMRVSKADEMNVRRMAKMAESTDKAALAQQRLATETERTAGAAANAANAQERLKRQQMQTEQMSRRITAHTEKQNRAYQSQGRILNELKGYALGYLSIHGASQLLSSLVRVTGEFELQKTTLSAMLGDLNAAEGIISRIQGLAVESPFQFKELTTYAKQLSAFSVPAQELYDTTKMLADISAGLGVGMDRIVLAYGQVRSAAFLRGQEVRQFTEAGIPILDELAKQFSELEGRAVSAGEVFDKISARLVPFEMVAKVFKDMTSEGGKFYNMQEIQAETLRGKISNLKDAYEVMLNEIGSAHSDKLKGAIDGVRNLMQNWERIGGQLVDLIKLFGAYKVAVGLLSISDTIAKFGGLAKAIQSTAAAQRLMNSALMTNPYIAVATAITAVAIAISRHRKELRSTTAAQNEYNRRVKELERIDRERSSAIRNLIDTVQDETQATVEREAALMSLKDAYPEIFAQYDIESLKLADILKIKKQISEEDAKRRKVEAYGSLGAQEGRIKALIARGASDNHIESATAVLREMQKGYLEKYVLPDMVSGLRDMTDDTLNKALQEAYRKSQYNTRGIEQFDGIPTTQDFYEDLYAAIQAEIKRRNSTKLVDGWRKKVQDTLSDLGLDEGTAFGLWAKDTTQSTEYVDALIKRYKELGEQIKNVSSFDKDQTERLQKNKDAIEAVAKALNIDIKSLTAEKGTRKKTQAQIDIEEQIKSVQELQKVYEKLTSYLNDTQMKTSLRSLFPNADQELIQSLDFRGKLKELATELNEFNEEAAQKLWDSISGEKVDDIVSVFKAIEEYKKALDKWKSEDFKIEGTGVSFDIGKIARDLNNVYTQIDQKAKQSNELLTKARMGDEEAVAKVREVYGEEFWREYIENGKDAIGELAELEKESARKTAQEKINEMASSYVSEQTFRLDLSDWSDKSIGQIEQIRQRLIELKNTDIQLPESTKTLLNTFGLSLDDLIAKIRELFGEQIENVTIEKFKALSGVIRDVSSAAGSLGDQFISLGETMDNDFLKGFGNSLKYLDELTDILTESETLMQLLVEGGEDAAEEIKEITEEAEDAAEATGEMSEEMTEGLKDVAKSSDLITMVIKLVVSLIGKLLSGINDSQKALADARIAAIEYANALNQIDYDNLMKASETVFGTDYFKQFQDAMEVIRDYGAAMDETIKKVGVSSKDLSEFMLDSSGWANFSKGLKSAWDGIKDLGEGDILVDARTGWQKFWGTGNDLIKTYSISDFIDIDGNIDGKALREFYETYGDAISDANAEAIEELLGQYDIYVDALEQIANYMSDIFGKVADDMADSFIDSFKKSGDAALDYGAIMDNVATNIAKSLIKSTLLENAFSEEMEKEAARKLASGDAAGAVGIVEQAMEAAENLAPYIEQLLNSLEPYFEVEDQGTTDMGEGIKSITEDQANLLASYLNAIRADVSFSKSLWVKMDANLQRIADIFVSTPTLMEYQAQIAANTYNTSITTHDILMELRSVVTTESGDASIRVYS